MDQNKIIKQAMTGKNFDEMLETMLYEIENQETDLKAKITQYHTQIISNCTSINELECHEGLEMLTQRLNNFAVSICLNKKKLEENDAVFKKCNDIFDLTLKLKSFLSKVNSNDENNEIFYKFNEMSREAKFFKNCIFYDKLKLLMHSQKTKITNKLKQQTSTWLGEMLKHYGIIGERVVKNESIKRNELSLPEILSPLYVFRKMELEDEFYDYFNSKRLKIASHLQFYEILGFIYVERALCDIDGNFELKKINTNYDKEELIVLIKYLKIFKFESSEAEQKLEKICCDFIIDNRENINSKADVDTFVEKGRVFLENVNSPAILEFYYKVVDDSILKYYEDTEIEKKIRQVHQFKTTDYKFKSLDKIKEIKKKEIDKIDSIFKEKRYENLKSVLLDNDTINYIKIKFTEKLKETDKDDEKNIEKEIVYFYIFLKGCKDSFAELFYAGFREDASN